ncbi:MAG TPA: hypothetical protein VEU31_00850 [Candidatus Acidoferrales bacterium]|nr:hypothetical protein [Candidatus Acidoferrales bacterium]
MKYVGWIGLVIAVILATIIYFLPATDHETKLKLAFSYSVLILLFFYGIIVLLLMAAGKIDLTHLLSEHGGGASMSRFQLLIFTFVIGLSFFLLATEGKGAFPEVPAGVLALLGISATTYGVSKGIQAGTDAPAKGDDGASGKGKS